MARIGVLTGLDREAACLAPLQDEQHPPLVRLSAAQPERARTLAGELAAAGVRGLVSFGLAGGLDPAIGGGTVVLPGAVVDERGGRWEVDAGWRDAVFAWGGEATLRVDLCVGVRETVADAAAKAALRARTGAAICDMESQHVAWAARAAGLPFLVVRAVVDAADTELPAWTLAAIDDAGRLRRVGMAAAALRRPGDWGKLIRLGRASGAASAELRRLAVAAGPLLGLPRL